MVNKGLALFQWKADMQAAEECCEEALKIDPDCDAAVATLAQLSLQQSKIERAVEMFKKQVDLARSEPELVNALTYEYVRLPFPTIAHPIFLTNVFSFTGDWCATGLP